MKQCIFTIGAILLAFLVVSPRAQAGWYDFFGGGAYQHDMDIARLNDIRQIGGYIAEYKEKTGHYPLMGEYDVPVYAHIATKEQQDVIKSTKGPPYEHVVIPTTEFIALLEDGLGRKITMPFDPQRAPNGRQNFYSYMVVDDVYFFAVHLYSAYPFAQKIDEDWYKTEISNVARPERPIWDYQSLMADPDFQKAAAEKMNKPGYVEQLREKLRREVGF